MTYTQRIESGEIFVNDGEALGVTLQNGSFYRLCRRCGGGGHYSFNLMDGTVCYGCSGSGLGKASTKADEIRLQNNRRAAARKRARAEQDRLARQETLRREWAEEHPALADALADMATDDRVRDPLLDLAQKAQWQALTPAQTEFAVRLVEEFTEQQAKITERREAQARAGHVGTVGEKITLDVEVVFVKSIESSFNGRPTYSNLVIMKTDEGATVKTFSSGSFGYAVSKGDRLRVQGTVKAHEERDGLPETSLTRVKGV